MGTTLTGTTPQDTYDSLIKVTDNGPLSGSLKVLTDGLGNNSAISLSTAAASVTGTLAVSSNVTLTSSGVSVRLGSATSNAGANILIAGASSTKNWSLGVQQNVSGALEFTPTATNGATTLGTTPAMVILDGGNVGIGTSTPAQRLDISSGALITTRIDSDLTCNDTQGLIYTRSNNISSIDGLRYASRSHRFVSHANTVYATIDADGLKFGSDTAAANALDDYEEGTFTPSVVYSTSGTPTQLVQTGLYTKIGRSVQVQIVLNWNENGSVGNVSLQGLPFTCATTAARPVPSIFSFGLTGVLTSITGVVVSNGTSIDLFLNDNAGTALSSTYTDNDQDMYVTLTYQAA